MGLGTSYQRWVEFKRLDRVNFEETRLNSGVIVPSGIWYGSCLREDVPFGIFYESLDDELGAATATRFFRFGYH